MDKYKSQKKAIVIKQERISEDIYSLWLESDTRNVNPGQFFMLYPKDNSRLLGRPISVCDVENDKIRFVYQKKGKGTSEFSALSLGEEITIMGPLGNGFHLTKKSSSPIIIGGGIGVAPLLYTAKQIKNATVILGYKNNTFLVDEFKKFSTDVLVATETGREGIKGTVIDVLNERKINKGTILSCGPMPMLRAITKYANDNKIETFVSLEGRMACGIGVCLGCVTPSNKINSHYMNNKLCICKDGPVFKASEVLL